MFEIGGCIVLSRIFYYTLLGAAVGRGLSEIEIENVSEPLTIFGGGRKLDTHFALPSTILQLSSL